MPALAQILINVLTDVERNCLMEIFQNGETRQRGIAGLLRLQLITHRENEGYDTTKLGEQVVCRICHAVQA